MVPSVRDWSVWIVSTYSIAIQVRKLGQYCILVSRKSTICGVCSLSNVSVSSTNLGVNFQFDDTYIDIWMMES